MPVKTGIQKWKLSIQTRTIQSWMPVFTGMTNELLISNVS
jgi:hypothetical protein